MAKRKRKKRKTGSSSDFPAWAWMLFGLAIGLSVAVAIYINDRTPPAPIEPAAQQPATTPEPAPAPVSAYDNNGELAAEEPQQEKPRFDFYDLLKNAEVEVVTEEAPAEETRAPAPQAIDEPGIYILQAGAFSAHEDADKRRVELALQNIESRIHRVTVDGRTVHRVHIGPIDDLDELNILRARLQQAKIDVLRIRIGD